MLLIPGRGWLITGHPPPESEIVKSVGLTAPVVM